MTSRLTDPVINELITLARQAGDAIMAVYRTGFEVTHKRDDSPLTEADLAAHRLIGEGLARLTPDVPVLSEESADGIPAERRLAWPRLWLVDPLDGTREFINRRDEFTVNLALVEGHRPVFGLVHLPVFDQTYWGCVQRGAWRLRGDGPAEAIRTAVPAASPPRVLGSRSHPDGHMAGFLAALGPHEMHAAGSSLKFCRLAEGLADVYPRFGPTSEWDTAAGQAVAEAAGGCIVDLAGQPLDCNRRESLLNPFFIGSGDPAADWLALLPAALRSGARACS